MVKGTVTIDRERCKGYQLCVEVCPQSVLRLSEQYNMHGDPTICLDERQHSCTGCALCARICPDMAGHAPTNLAAIYVTLLKVSQMIADLPDLCELDINPLLADAQGVLALDARIRVRPAQPTIGGAYCENFWNDAHEQPKHEQSL